MTLPLYANKIEAPNSLLRLPYTALQAPPSSRLGGRSIPPLIQSLPPVLWTPVPLVFLETCSTGGNFSPVPSASALQALFSRCRNILQTLLSEGSLPLTLSHAGLLSVSCLPCAFHTCSSPAPPNPTPAIPPPTAPCSCPGHPGIGPVSSCTSCCQSSQALFWASSQHMTLLTTRSFSKHSLLGVSATTPGSPRVSLRFPSHNFWASLPLLAPEITVSLFGQVCFLFYTVFQDNLIHTHHFNYCTCIDDSQIDSSSPGLSPGLQTCIFIRLISGLLCWCTS